MGFLRNFQVSSVSKDTVSGPWLDKVFEKIPAVIKVNFRTWPQYLRRNTDWLLGTLSNHAESISSDFK